METITKTQIENIDATTILDRFNQLELKLESFKEKFQPKEPNEYLTRQEVAKLFRITVVTCQEWDKKGILKPYKVGNKVRYIRAEVEAALIRKNS